jgi:hypothetical protein
MGWQTFTRGATPRTASGTIFPKKIYCRDLVYGKLKIVVSLHVIIHTTYTHVCTYYVRLHAYY